MSFKTQWHRNRLRKKVEQGFRGYPVATLAYYGPNDERATKVVVAVVPVEGAEPDPIEKWFSESGDARTDGSIIDSIVAFIQTHSIKSVIGVERIIGCPHEEGIDYPEGSQCPVCPFWGNRDRFSGKALR